MLRKALSLVLWLGAAIATGTVGAIASVGAPAFYAALAKPTWAPPPSLFGPVWTMLYLMMGLAAWLVWRERGWKGAAGPLALFLVHLPINAVWSWVFFAWHRGAASFAVIVTLWILIAILGVMFFRIRRLAGALLIPYLCWVTFAAALNYAVWQANPTLLP
jgi:tryptophan-rich sensory protein